jgi:ribosomal-protein-alanine N-acetyltransferase
LEALAFGGKSWGADSVRASFVASRVTVLLGGADEATPSGFALWRDLGEEAEILTLGTAGTTRRRGLGAALLEAMIDAARAGGAHRIFLEVSARNEAGMALYQQAGFHDIGTRKSYYADGADARVMALSL